MIPLLLSAVGSFASPAAASVSYVGRVGSGTTATSSTRKVLTAGRSVAAGDALLVGVMLSTTGTGIVSVTDAAGNAYSVDRDQNDGSANDRVLVFSSRNVRALANGAAITVNYPTAAQSYVSVDEFSGLTAPDRSASAFAKGTSFNSGNTPTTSQTNELLFGVAGNESGNVATWAAGWTALPTLSIGTDRLGAAYRMVSATGAYNASGATSGTWMAGIVTYTAGAPPPPDRAPVVIAPTTANMNENSQLTFDVTASDPDGQALTSLTANLASLPPGNNAVFRPNPTNTGGTLTWTPTFAHAPGPYNVTFTAANALSGSATTAITVNNVDRAPAITAPATRSAPEGTIMTLIITAADPDGEAIASLSADLTQLPAGKDAAFTANPTNTGGTLTWTPNPTDTGPYAVTFMASNALPSNPAQTLLTVDHHPVVSASASVTATENQPLTFTVSVSEPDSGQTLASLTANLASLPPGNNAVFTPNSTNTGGALTWTPTFADAPGPYNVTFSAVNTLSGSATTAITVDNVDAPPVVMAPATRSAPEGMIMTLIITAADPDSEAITSLSADLTQLPTGNDARFTPNSTNTGGALTWTPNPTDTGPYAVTFTASNALPSNPVQTSLTVDHHPAVTAPAGVTATENQPLTLTVTVSEPDSGQALASLTANLASLPPGNNAVFTPNSTNTAGTLTWTPTFADAPGPYNVAFTAVNTLSGSATTAITVDNVDRAPIVTVAPSANVNERQQLSLGVTAADPDGDAIASLSADLTALPVPNNAVFTPNTANTAGTLTWTPAAGMGRVAPYGVTFTAANARSGLASSAISVNVTPVAALTATPASGNAPLPVTLNAAGSSDVDGSIRSYSFEFGDASPVVGPQATSSATHTYSAGTWTATVTVTDDRGANATVARAITVTATATTYVGRVASGTTATSSTRKALTAGRSVAAGDALLVGVMLSTTATGIVSVTDAAGNAYSLDRDQNDGSAGDRVLVFSSRNVRALANGAAITVNYPTAAQSYVSVDEFSGLTAPDRSASAFAKGTSFNSGNTPTTSQTNELLFGVVGNESGNVATWPASWTALPTLSIGTDRLGAAYRMVSATDAYNASGTTSGTWMAGIVTYTAGPPPENPPTASLSVTRNSSPPLTVTADASASTDTDLTPIASYRFDFGDGTTAVTTSVPTATAQHTYTRTGTYAVTLIVTDTGARPSAPASVSITLSSDSPPTARLSVTNTSTPPLGITADASGSTDTDATPIARYRFDFGDGTSAVTTSAPTATASHTYATGGAYTVTLIATDTANNSSLPVSTSVTVSAPTGSAVAVYAGYYDTHHPDTRPKPNPWMGSPNAVFVGQPDGSSGGWDTGAVRVDNLGTGSLTGVGVTVDIGSNHFALWGTNTIPPGTSLILAQTSFENFDGSDTNPAGCVGCSPGDCQALVRSTVPVVHLTVGGATVDYFDTGQHINTHGVDAAGCPYTGSRNDESEAWVRIYPRQSAGAQVTSSTSQPAQAISGRSVSIAPAQPNPTHGKLDIRFRTASRGPVRIGVYDVMGRLVRVCVQGIQEAGAHSERVDLTGTASGIYLCKMWTPEGMLQESFVIIR